MVFCIMWEIFWSFFLSGEPAFLRTGYTGNYRLKSNLKKKFGRNLVKTASYALFNAVLAKNPFFIKICLIVNFWSQTVVNQNVEQFQFRCLSKGFGYNQNFRFLTKVSSFKISIFIQYIICNSSEKFWVHWKLSMLTITSTAWTNSQVGSTCITFGKNQYGIKQI